MLHLSARMHQENKIKKKWPYNRILLARSLLLGLSFALGLGMMGWLATELLNENRQLQTLPIELPQVNYKRAATSNTIHTFSSLPLPLPKENTKTEVPIMLAAPKKSDEAANIVSDIVLNKKTALQNSNSTTAQTKIKISEPIALPSLVSTPTPTIAKPMMIAVPKTKITVPPIAHLIIPTPPIAPPYRSTRNKTTSHPKPQPERAIIPPSPWQTAIVPAPPPSSIADTSLSLHPEETQASKRRFYTKPRVTIVRTKNTDRLREKLREAGFDSVSDTIPLPDGFDFTKKSGKGIRLSAELTVNQVQRLLGITLREWPHLRYIYLDEDSIVPGTFIGTYTEAAQLYFRPLDPESLSRLMQPGLSKQALHTLIRSLIL